MILTNQSIFALFDKNMQKGFTNTPKWCIVSLVDIALKNMEAMFIIYISYHTKDE